LSLDRIRTAWPAPGQASEIFPDHLLERCLIQGELRHQPEQPGVLFCKLPGLTDLGGHQSPKLLLPAVKGLLANPHLAGNLAHLRPLRGLLQGKGNLPVGKPGPLHRENPPGQIFSSEQNALILNGPVLGEQTTKQCGPTRLIHSRLARSCLAVRRRLK
jgi:hypothetical protein